MILCRFLWWTVCDLHCFGLENLSCSRSRSSNQSPSGACLHRLLRGPEASGTKAASKEVPSLLGWLLDLQCHTESFTISTSSCLTVPSCKYGLDGIWFSIQFGHSYHGHGWWGYWDRQSLSCDILGLEPSPPEKLKPALKRLINNYHFRTHFEAELFSENREVGHLSVGRTANGTDDREPPQKTRVLDSTHDTDFFP
jgi:hypothetical protein